MRDIVDELNSEYMDWAFSRSVVAAVVVQMQANWVADFRTSLGFELIAGDRGDELTIEDSARAQPWLVRQVERYAMECQARLLSFSRSEADLA